MATDPLDAREGRAPGRFVRDLALAGPLFCLLCGGVAVLYGGSPAGPLPAEAPAATEGALQARFLRCGEHPGWRADDHYELYGPSADGRFFGLASWVTLQNAGTDVARGAVIHGRTIAGGPLRHPPEPHIGPMRHEQQQAFRSALQRLLRRYRIAAPGTKRSGQRCKAKRRARFIAGSPPARHELALRSTQGRSGRCVARLTLQLTNAKGRRELPSGAMAWHRRLDERCTVGHQIEAVYETSNPAQLVVVISYGVWGKVLSSHGFMVMVAPLDD